MRFYTTTHKHYCGIDLHARNMYVCILDQEGKVLLHRNLRTERDFFLRSIAPYREDLAVAVECMFTWYWLADLCAQEGIHFIDRFERVQDFASYARLVKCEKSSGGKKYGTSGAKIGNVHLK
jgi:transposase